MSFTLPRSLSRTAWRSYGTVQGSPSAASIASRVPSVLVEATSATAPRTNWTPEEVSAVYHTPLNQLTYASVRFHDYPTLQLGISLLSLVPSMIAFETRKTKKLPAQLKLINVHRRLPYTDASMTPRPFKCVLS